MSETLPEWRVMIADDEPMARKGVRQLLAPYPEFRIVSECRNGAEVLAQLDTTQPHVVFLDVQMPGIDGFEVIRRRTPERMPIVIFLTAYDEFALKAFEAQAQDYLVKPVTEVRFAASIRRLARMLAGGVAAREPSIAVTTTRGTRVLTLSEIEWIEAADNYSRIWVNQKNYLLRESLGSLERRIQSHGFLRVHRQALIRLGAVRKLVKTDDDGLIATLTSGARIPVSRRKRAVLIKAVRVDATSSP